MNAKTVLKLAIVILLLTILVAGRLTTLAGAEMFRYDAQHCDHPERTLSGFSRFWNRRR